MGSVYRARDLETGQVVALKVLTIDRPFDLVRFGREATLLAKVKHSNVVNYVAHGESDGVHYLVQEWVEGVTLAEKLQSTGVTVTEAITVALGLAGALDATHSRGIIHRDIKPANIILADDRFDRVKLVDFGIARLTSDAGVLTRTGRLVGTPSYMAPEQARGSVNLEAAADVWSFGCVLYEALSGRVAFDGRSPAAVRVKVLLDEPSKLALLCPEAPPELLDLVRAMLAKDPARRPASGPNLVERLKAIPQVADSPRRRVGNPEAATVAMPARPPRNTEVDQQAAGCFVLVAPVDVPAAAPDENVAKVAERHHMNVHVFDDGATLLVASGMGKEAAVEAARAAIELREEVPDGAVSVFGRSTEDSLADAIDRGSLLLERGMMGTLFGDLVGNADPVVHIDEVIAELIGPEMPVASTVDGPVLRIVRRADSSAS
ncbi:MAG TPA: serine/threonine-protein kinase [Kofleriaceae bacterium]|nr:serine/threonine-protein kinase [Kofleriaceae bacterium]